MIALFFEVLPRAGHEQVYLDLASRLKPELEQSGGLVSIDRYRSLARPGWMLSHQIWADEASLVAWRTHGTHHGVQIAGRTRHFADYRLRVGAVIAEASHGRPMLRNPVPPASAYNDPARRPPRMMVAVAAEGRPFEGDGLEPCESVYAAGRFISIGATGSEAAALELIERSAVVADVTQARAILVSRDYGMRERAEAPQVMPPIPPA